MNTILTIIPAYNKEEFLEGAIESILQQTYKDIKLIIIDDCSIDKTLQIAKSYEHLNNVTVLSNTKNRGTYYSINKGLNYALELNWDYLTFHGADDISSVDRFNKLLPYFKNPNTLGLKTTYIRVDRQHTPQLTPSGDIDIYPSEGIAIYPRKTIELLGYFDNTRFSGDTDYWWRLEAFCSQNLQYNVKSSTEILYYAISHENNLTKKYNFTYDRPQYFNKIKNEIETIMAPSNNFYREIFE